MMQKPTKHALGWTALILLSLLTSCAANGPGAGSGCGWVRPIYVSPNDKLSDDTAKQILAHDKAVKAVCGGG